MTLSVTFLCDYDVCCLQWTLVHLVRLRQLKINLHRLFFPAYALVFQRYNRRFAAYICLSVYVKQ